MSGNLVDAKKLNLDVSISGIQFQGFVSRLKKSFLSRLYLLVPLDVEVQFGVSWRRHLVMIRLVSDMRDNIYIELCPPSERRPYGYLGVVRLFKGRREGETLLECSYSPENAQILLESLGSFYA